MGVSPSSHEPVRIAPMVRRCSPIDARHHDGDLDHHAERSSAAARAAGSAKYSDHGGGGGRAAPKRADDISHDDTSDRGVGGSVSTSAADVFYQRGGGAGFVVGQSRERLSAVGCIGRGGGRRSGDSGGAGRGLEAAAPRADGAAAEKDRDAAELVSVGYDEWKEACTAEGKM